MKNTEKLLLILTALACTILFYKESWGLNVPLFAILITSAQLIHKPALKHNRSWLWISAATLVSALAYYFTNNGLAVFLFVCSVLFTSGIQLKNSMLLFLPAHAFLNFFIAPFSLVKHEAVVFASGKPSRFSLRMLIVPSIIFSVFLAIYANANSRLLEQVRMVLNNLNLSFIFSLILSFFVVLPLIKGRIISWLSVIEDSIEKIIGYVSNAHPSENAEKTSKLLKEAMLVFSSLILLLTYLITLDGIDLFSGINTTSLSENLHGSIYILIVSMFLAIAVILYYFSLPIVYHASFSKVKLAVLVWIGLNIILCMICFMKNNLYVHELGLTYKRIGVYTYLIMTAFALLITAYKVHTAMHNWVLIKNNTWMIYAVLLVFSCIPWDIIITHYNMSYTKNPDVDYIRSLSKTARLEYYRIKLSNIKTNEELGALTSEFIEHDNYYLDWINNNTTTKSYLSLTAEDIRFRKEYLIVKNTLLHTTSK